MLLGFKKRFKQPILDGTKKFTIRERRKIEPKIGETLYMYTGLRTRDCEKITDKHKLESIQLVSIKIQELLGITKVQIVVDGKWLDDDMMQSFAIWDGFKDINDFCNYWLEGIKTEDGLGLYREAKDLVLYHWTYLRI